MNFDGQLCSALPVLASMEVIKGTWQSRGGAEDLVHPDPQPQRLTVSVITQDPVTFGDSTANAARE